MEKDSKKPPPTTSRRNKRQADMTIEKSDIQEKQNERPANIQEEQNKHAVVSPTKPKPFIALTQRTSSSDETMEVDNRKPPPVASKKNKKQADMTIENSDIQEEQNDRPADVQEEQNTHLVSPTKPKRFIALTPSPPPRQKQSSFIIEYLHFFRVYGRDEAMAGLAFYFTRAKDVTNTAWSSKLLKDVMEKLPEQSGIHKGTVKISEVYVQKAYKYTLHEKNIMKKFGKYGERVFIIYTPQARTMTMEIYNTLAAVLSDEVEEASRDYEAKKPKRESESAVRLTRCVPNPKEDKFVNENKQNVWSDIVGMEGAKLMLQYRVEVAIIANDRDWGYNNPDIVFTYFRRNELSKEHEIIEELNAGRLFA